MLYLLVKLDLSILELRCEEKLSQLLIFYARYLEFVFQRNHEHLLVIKCILITWCKNFPLRRGVDAFPSMGAYT